MGLGQTLRARSTRARGLLTVVCVCVACLQLSTGASAAAWVTQSALAPALVDNGVLSSVSCLAPAPCVAVGSFVSASGADRSLIEIRRGRQWSIQASPVPPGAGDTELSAVACAAKRSCLAVGSDVLTNGKVTLAERWNGSSWSILRTINPIRAGGQLSGLSCSSARFCMAVGSGPRGTLIERWSGSRWSLQHPANLGAASAGQLDGVSCPSRRSCVAVGSTRRSAVAELWNGRRWSRLRRPQGVDALNAISCTSPQACSAISDTNETYAVQRWNGRRWTSEEVPAQACDPAETCSNILSSITCVSASSCYLVGTFDTAATGSSGLDTTTPLAASWHGSVWHAERVRDVGVCPTNNTEVCGTPLNGISCTAQSVCVAVGTYSNAAGVGQPLIEHRNAGGWSLQPAPSPLGPASSQLTAVSCWSAAACTAVGSYTDASGGSFLLAERWNGATWTIQPTPGAGQFNGVSCTSATACIAVGATDFALFPFSGVTLAETWNGTTWTATQTSGAGSLNAISCTSPTACVAVGETPSGSGLTESWNGATWTVQPGSGGGPWVGLSCVSADACWAARTDPTGGIADSWDGTSWTALPLPQPQLSPPNPFYSAISCPALNTCTVVLNNLSMAGSGGLALRWDGTAWSTQPLQLPAREYVNTIGGVSCPSAMTCTAVGSDSISESNGPESYGPLLERWDGSSWFAQPPPAPYQSAGAVLNAVSCPSTTSCMAVGEGSIVIPNGVGGFVYNFPYVLSYS
jgi:hypothetical protein